MSGGADRDQPHRPSYYGLQEASGETTAATFLFIVSATTNNGKAFGHAAHGVLHLVNGSSTFFAISANNGKAFGHAAHGVLHLINGSSSAFFSLLGFLSLLVFPSL